MDENLNRQFRIVYQPYDNRAFAYGRRFLVSANRLQHYVGANNAFTAFQRALKSLTDKTTVKFRTHGRIDFYVK